jgi:outer membrane protein TolC
LGKTIALNDQITAVQILGRRMAAAVLLIQALGGGWISEALPTPAAASAP